MAFWRFYAHVLFCLKSLLNSLRTAAEGSEDLAIATARRFPPFARFIPPRLPINENTEEFTVHCSFHHCME